MKNNVIIGLICWVCISLFTSCTDEQLDIQQDYGFKITHLPIPKEISENGMVEIRCELEAEGNYQDANYTIRFFQNEGKGQLFLEDTFLEIPNDRYPLENKVFRLYYKAMSSQNHQFDVYIEDSFGQVEKVGFKFDTQAQISD